MGEVLDVLTRRGEVLLSGVREPDGRVPADDVDDLGGGQGLRAQEHFFRHGPIGHRVYRWWDA